METQKINLRCEAERLPVHETDSNTGRILALLLSPRRPVDLADMSRSITADMNLCYRVTEAARSECGGIPLAVEDAIVLLGVQRLCDILSGGCAESEQALCGAARRRNEKTISVVANHPQIRNVR